MQSKCSQPRVAILAVCLLLGGFTGTSTAASQDLSIPGGSSIEAQYYNADIHQKLLKRPSSWCGRRRPNDPLMREAIRMVTAGPSDTFASYRRTHGIPKMDRRAVVLVQDQTICETAAKAYDRIFHSIDLLAKHKSIQPVLVIRLGTVFVVEEARKRGGYWEVMFFDGAWRHLGFGYGAGA